MSRKLRTVAVAAVAALALSIAGSASARYAPMIGNHTLPVQPSG